jgi:hypothetical protein
MVNQNIFGIINSVIGDGGDDLRRKNVYAGDCQE